MDVLIDKNYRMFQRFLKVGISPMNSILDYLAKRFTRKLLEGKNRIIIKIKTIARAREIL